MTISPVRSLLSRKSTPYVLMIVLGVSGIVYGLIAGLDPMEKVRLAIRYTARASFLFFIVTYSASALVRLWPNPNTLAIMRNRFHWGTAFALATALQAMAFSPFLFMDDNGETAQRVYIGTIGLAIIFGMSLTPLKAAGRAGNLTVTKWFHRVGMHLIWLLFFLQYQFYVTHGIREMTSVPLVGLCIGILVLRIAAWIKTLARKYQVRPVAASPTSASPRPTNLTV